MDVFWGREAGFEETIPFVIKKLSLERFNFRRQQNQKRQEKPQSKAEVPYGIQINFTDDFIDEELENKFMNSGSIIFNKINKEKHYFDTKMLLSQVSFSQRNYPR